MKMVSIPESNRLAYINNSPSGGIILTVIKIGKDSSIIFVSDTLYSGIDSALIALQSIHYSIHAP
jgi:hypothetical protein